MPFGVPANNRFMPGAMHSQGMPQKQSPMLSIQEMLAMQQQGQGQPQQVPQQPAAIQAPKDRGMFGRFMGAIAGKPYGEEQMGWVERLGRGADGMNAIRDKQATEAKLQKAMQAMGLDPRLQALASVEGLGAAVGQQNRGEDMQRSDARYADTRTDRREDVDWRQMTYGDSRDDRADDVAHRDLAFQTGVDQFGQTMDLRGQFHQDDMGLGYARLKADKEAARAKAEAEDVPARYLSPEELAAAGYPENSVVQKEAGGKDQVRYKPQAEFSAGEIKGFRDTGRQITQFQDTLGEYKSLVGDEGLKKFHKGDNLTAAKLDGFRQSLTFQAKDLFNLGVLSKDDYDNIDRLIPDATGLGAFWKNKDSFNASLTPVESMMSGQMSRIPEQYRPSAPPENLVDGTVPPTAGQGQVEFDAADQIPEGATVEDENGVRWRKQNGQLVRAN